MTMKQQRKEIPFIAGFMALFALAAATHASAGVMLTPFIEEYGLDGAAQGFCGTAESVGVIISLFISAAMLEIMPKKRVILIMAFLMSLVLIGIGLHPSRFLILCFWYVLFGVSLGVFDSLSSSVISDVYQKKSGKMMTYTKAVYSLGGMTFPPVMNAMLSKGLPWHQVALIMGGFGFAVFIYYFLFASPNVPVESGNKSDRLTWREIKAFLKLKGTLRVLLFGLMFYGHTIGITIWIVRYICNYLQEPVWGGFALSFYWIGVLSARFILPHFITGHRKFFFFGNICAAVFFIAGILIGNGRLMCIFVLLSGFAEGPANPMLIDYACSLDRTKSTVACSVIIFTNNVGSIIIPPAIGALILMLGANIGIFILPLLSLACALTATGMKDSENECQ